MDSENRMAFRRSLMPLALLAALAATSSCTDPSPLGVPAFRRGGRGQEGSTKGTGLLACSQTYDSVTQVVGPAGGFIVVGSHILWVDTGARGHRAHHRGGFGGHGAVGSVPARRPPIPDQRRGMVGGALYELQGLRGADGRCAPDRPDH